MFETLHQPKTKANVALYLACVFAVPVCLLTLALLGLSHFALNEKWLDSSSILGFRSMFAGMIAVSLCIFISAFSMAFELPRWPSSAPALAVVHSCIWFLAFKVGWVSSISIGLRAFTLQAFSLNWGTMVIWFVLLAYAFLFAVSLQRILAKCNPAAS